VAKSASDQVCAFTSQWEFPRHAPDSVGTKKLSLGHKKALSC
jgi:hypothetical protein